MGKIIGDTQCPSCAEKGGDKTGNHLMLFIDGGGYCNRCGYTKPIQEREEESMSKLTLDTVNTFPYRTEYRGIKPIVAEIFGVRQSVDGGGELAASYYPVRKNGKVTGYKQRQHPKKFYSIGDMKGDTELFGVVEEGNKFVFITGGEEDAMACYQMMKAKSPQYGCSVFSLVHGESAVKDIANNLDMLSKYDSIVFCLDQDGKTKVAEMAALVGDKAKIMEFSEKDANDMLLKGKHKEFISSFWNAKGYTPDTLVTVEDVQDKAKLMPQWGRLYPWGTLNKLTFGRRDGEGIYVGAGTKAGKTEWLSQMVHHITETEGSKVLLFKFEQPPEETVKALAGKIMNKRFNVPDGDFTQEDLNAGVEAVKGKVFMFNKYMNGQDNENLWDMMKPVIRYSVLNLGVKDVFIDPITQLTDGMTASETDVELRRISNQLAGMAIELGFFYYCFCHLKAPTQGKTHEEGGSVKVAQFRGSRAMMEKTKYALGIVRDQYAEDEVERNTSTFHVLLNSGVGRTGNFPVVYDDTTGDYLEPKNTFM